MVKGKWSVCSSFFWRWGYTKREEEFVRVLLFWRRAPQRPENQTQGRFQLFSIFETSTQLSSAFLIQLYNQTGGFPAATSPFSSIASEGGLSEEKKPAKTANFRISPDFLVHFISFFFQSLWDKGLNWILFFIWTEKKNDVLMDTRFRDYPGSIAHLFAGRARQMCCCCPRKRSLPNTL